MPKSQRDTGASEPQEPQSQEQEPEPGEGDTIIEMVDGHPYIYENNAANRAKMAKVRS
jgi:hypothetical protein